MEPIIHNALIEADLSLMKINYKILIFSLFIPLLAGLIGSFFTTPAIDTWYEQLIKPSYNPPNWLFAPVWTALYILMGVSLYLIIQTKKKKGKEEAITLFAAQLALNIVWSIVFFEKKDILLALFEIGLLWVFILATMIKFYKLNTTAGLLFIPYLLWVSFASVLNLAILMLN